MFDKLYNKIVVFTAMTFLLFGSIFIISEIYDIEHNINTYKYNTNKYSDNIAIEEICMLFNCSSIRIKEHTYFFDKNIPVYKSIIPSIPSHNLNIHEDYYIDYDSMMINIKLKNNIFVYLDLTKNKDKEVFIFLVSLPLIMLFIIYMIMVIIVDARNEALIINAGNEALMTNKSMILITENIHHELNTPLDIMDNKIEKIHRIVDNYIVAEYENWLKYNNFDNDRRVNTLDEYIGKEKRKTNRLLLSLGDDFNFIKTSSEQIYNILEKMKGFKHLRYTNNIQDIKTIVVYAFKMVSISNTNYEHKIDEKLGNYTLDTSKIKNADLLNVLINHIKNSLEANASKVIILFHNFKNDLLYLRIIDNGSGIPTNIKKKIFAPNFSTKTDEQGIRGNGMYLNKHIMEVGGGHIELIETSSSGTTMELALPTTICESI